MLRSVWQTREVVPSAFCVSFQTLLLCHSERFCSVIPSASALSFRAIARNPVWMLHFVQHDKSESVIPSGSEESSEDVSQP